MSLKLRKNISVGVGLLWVKWLFAEGKQVGPSLWDFQKTCCSSEMAVSRPLLTLKNNAIFSRNHSKCHKLKKQENRQKSGFYIVNFKIFWDWDWYVPPIFFEKKNIEMRHIYIYIYTMEIGYVFVNFNATLFFRISAKKIIQISTHATQLHRLAENVEN